jgi:hypothetical protein
MFYSVNNTNFINKLLAADHAVRTNTDIKFNLYEEAFDRADWSKEPEQSWDQLLDIRANQIAAKGKPIVLNFSGGTDSYTIYKVFERNNVHIDALYLRRRKTDLDTFINTKVLEMFNQGLYDKTTKIIIKEDSEEVFTSAYCNEDWLWSNQARMEFIYGFNSDASTHDYISREIGTEDYVSVIGFEKPKLHFDKFMVHSYQDDLPYTRAMGHTVTENFYISPDLPELHIKQSYMMLNYIRKKHPDAYPKDLIPYNNFGDPTKFSWDEYAHACGRFGDLAMSGTVHTAWRSLKLVIPKSGIFTGHEHTGPGENWYKSLVGTKLFDNYTRGILRIKDEPAYKYLRIDSENAYKLKSIVSKSYRLTFDITKN